jgi:predicted RNA-binding Zn ribbon-like protein
MAGRAPGPLALVQDFVNTLDVEEQTELIGTPEALGAWLGERGLGAGRRVTPADQVRAIELREALRRLLVANNGGQRREADLGLLNLVATESGLRPRFTAEGGVRLLPSAPGVPGSLGSLLAAVSEAMTQGTWHRLKACAEHGCRWAFYDRSKNRSGHWCSMEVCGNRAKARQFRQRRRGEGTASPSA